MTDWFILTILVTFIFGIQSFIYKIIAEKKLNTIIVTFTFMFTVSLLGISMFIIKGDIIQNLKILIILGVIDSIGYTFLTICRIETLKYLAANIAIPIIRMNSVLAIIYSIVVFKDQISTMQIIGILIAFIAIYIIVTEKANEKTESKKKKKGLIIAFIAVFLGTSAIIVPKYATMNNLSESSFIVASYTCSTIISLIILIVDKNRKKKSTINKISLSKKLNSVKFGILQGCVNFAAFYLLLLAIGSGQLSIVTAIVGTSFLIPIILSRIFYKESITKKKIIAIAMVLIAVLFMKNINPINWLFN